MPFLAHWPAKIKAGSVNDEVFCTTDFMATCAELLEVRLPDNAGEDSVTMLPAFYGKKVEHARKAVIHHSLRGNYAIRQGKWKYIVTNGSGGWVWTCNPSNMKSTDLASGPRSPSLSCFVYHGPAGHRKLRIQPLREESLQLSVIGLNPEIC